MLAYLDADAAKPGDDSGYSVFGRVVDGINAVCRILGARRSAIGGTGATSEQTLAAPVRIVSVRRLK